MEVSNRAEGLKETYDVAGRDFSSAGAASSRIKRILQQIGVDQGIIRRIAVSSYEAEMNLVIHASNGGRITLDISPDAVTILVEDDGPGITDIKKAMQPGYSTASDEIREMG
ncbi:MAG TPA: ATP-binding protein, partial [Armatimonadota bacterium]|nr:ATP-binding protein [Armatimonadota bacterium]